MNAAALKLSALGKVVGIMKRIAVVGSINLDVVVQTQRHPLPGETVLGRQIQHYPGGKGANQALAAALMGGDVTMIGAVGEDDAATQALHLLQNAGVNLMAVRRSGGHSTGTAIITVADDGENAIVVIPGANLSVSPAQATQALTEFGVGDLVVLQGELPVETVCAAVRYARDHGMQVVLNVAPWVEVDRDVLTAANPLVLNEHELRLAVASLDGERNNADLPGALQSVEEDVLAQRLLSEGVESVVVTLGGRGCLVVDHAGVRPVPAQSVPVVDTTGAGDAFVGALSARIAAGEDLESAARFATRVSALVVQRAGAQPSYPQLEDL